MYKQISITQILENELTNQLYSNKDQRFVELVQSIEIHGILEPLVVRFTGDTVMGYRQYEVISGNRRLRAARELDLKEVPVIVRELGVITREVVRAHQEQRLKTRSELIREFEELKKTYGLRQGVRSDVDAQAREGRLKKQQYVTELGKSKVDRLNQYASLARVLSGGDERAFEERLAKLDNADSLNKALKSLQAEFKERKNVLQGDVPEVTKVGNATIFNRSCADLSGIEDESVACIVTSPPYFQLRDYVLGGDRKGLQTQLGQESTADEFIENLVEILTGAKRVLKQDGSLFVNIFDTIHKGHMMNIPFKLVLKMVEKGWILNDTIVWSKKNPRYTANKRTVASHEYIFHFVKSVQFYHDMTWIQKYSFDPHQLTYGGEGKKVRLRSDLQFDGSTLVAAVANNDDLKRQCEQEGVYLTHSATFPMEIPLVSILCATKEGDLVMDLFNGTSTVGSCATQLGRAFVGFELNPSYVRASVVRLRNVDNQDQNSLNQAA
jgi:DNA modification methylase